MSNLVRNLSKIAINTVINALFMGTLVTSYSIQARAQNSNSSYTQLTDRVVLETKNVDSMGFVSALSDSVQKILVSSWFKDRLPEKFGIIVDGAWTKSAGYFSSDLKTIDPKTQNSLPAILLEPRALDQNQTLALTTHELTHLINNQLRPQSNQESESWIKEGIAMMAEWIVTGEYGTAQMNPSINQAFKTPETSLIAPLDPNHEDYKNTQIRTAQYGHILQYFLYVYRLCGKTAVLEKLMSSPSPKTGVELMDEVLKSMNAPSIACKSFHDSFIRFSLARFKQDIAEEDYVYRTAAESTVREKAIDLPPYSSEAYQLNPDSKQKSCLKGEYKWGSSICIRIRES